MTGQRWILFADLATFVHVPPADLNIARASIQAVKCWTDYVLLPALQWDIIAGVSVGAMVVPQGLSYASIAGVPSVYGLYGAFMPCIIYALFGSSKQLAVGPVAVTSLLIGNGMVNIVPGTYT